MEKKNKEAPKKRCFYGQFCRSGENGNGWCNEVNCIGMKCLRCGGLMTFRVDWNGWQCPICRERFLKLS